MLKINAFILFLIAPFLALFLVSADFVQASTKLELPIKEVKNEVKSIHNESENFHQEIIELTEEIGRFHSGAVKQNEVFNQQDNKITELSKSSDTQKKLSDDIYEQKILNMLGPAIKAHISDKTEIKIFKLNELGYRGYIAKVKLFDPKAFQVTVAKDTPGKLETVSSMSKRKDAILGINGGGFSRIESNGEKAIKMMGYTTINGRLVEPFQLDPGVFFAGIDNRGKVVGGVPTSKKDLFDLNPYQGVSFVPVLLKDGRKNEIPKSWKKTRHPRTILGRYANGDIIMIVIDGRQGSWSIGVSLERLQDKLLELGVKDAYNLDGGGSSTFYYNGEILNRPSDGRERPVVNSILVRP